MASAKLPSLAAPKPDLSPAEKAEVYVTVYQAILDGDVEKARPIVEPIYARHGRTAPETLQQCNRFAVAVNKALAANDATVIAVLKAAGVPVDD